MKKLFFFALFSLALTGTILAQRASIVGNWTGQFTGQDGNPLKFNMTITENTYQFDIGMDGTADMSGAYTLEGDQVTVWDTAGANTCPSDQKGVYKFVVEGDTATFTKVSDACPARGNEPLVLKRI